MISKVFSKNYILFLIILFVAILLRFACLDKTSGLWYDELVMYNQAFQPTLKKVVFTALSQDVHLPLFQILLHYWMKILGNSDFVIRCFSAICGVLTVVIGFFIGKNLKSYTTGLILMSLFAVNSFLIYYSQEVRMYELLAFFATLNILSLIKLQHKKWCFLWILSSCGLILTYTISILYVFLQIIAYCIFKNKEIDKNFVISSILIFILNLPIIYYLVAFKEKFTHFITGFYSDWSSLFVVLQNFFTPKIIGLGSNPPHYIKEFFSNFSFTNLIFVFIPIIISIYLIVIALKESKFARFLFILSFAFLMVEVVAFVFTDFKILSRYLIIILPNLLTIMAIKVDKNKLTKILFVLFLVINLGYLTFSDNSVFKMQRTGFLPLVNLLQENNIKDNDVVIVWNRKDILSKYLDKKVITLSILQDFAYKSEFIFENGQKLNSSSENKKKEILRSYFKSGIVPNNTLMLANYMIKNIQKGQKVMITSYNYFDIYDYETFLNVVNNDKEYKNVSYNNLMTIKSLLDLKFICSKKLTYKNSFKKDDFIIYVYEK